MFLDVTVQSKVLMTAAERASELRAGRSRTHHRAGMDVYAPQRSSAYHLLRRKRWCAEWLPKAFSVMGAIAASICCH
jgi:hypothetical protein